jgi:hypothetical protein
MPKGAGRARRQRPPCVSMSAELKTICSISGLLSGLGVDDVDRNSRGRRLSTRRPHSFSRSPRIIGHLASLAARDPRIAYVEEWRVLDLFGGCLHSATPSCCQASVSPAKLGSARGHPSPDDAIRSPRARSPDQCRDSNVMMAKSKARTR